MNIAIYSRKSKLTDKGESIQTQIELCRDYIRFHFKENSITIYEDEGFSGGNVNRPEFHKLMQDIKNKKINILMCYRLDRVSRNVADFADTLNILQKYDVAFISIKEQFDTSSPMGRAMVYIASVFAQLERETIADRIKDNMLELSKDGRWLGGQTPLGFNRQPFIYYDSTFNEKKMSILSPVKEELEKVELIYGKYLETNSISRTLKYLLSANIKGKNGGDFASMSINDILRNPSYVKSSEEVFKYLLEKGMNLCGIPNGKGMLIYNKKDSKYHNKVVAEWIAAVSKHEGIINPNKWLEVQKTLDKNARKENPRTGTSKKSLLSGILKCAHCGSPMRVSYGHKKKDGSNRIYYYTCTMKAHSGKTRCSNKNVRGEYIENAVINSLMDLNKDLIMKVLESLRNEAVTPLTISPINLIKKEIKEKESSLYNLTKQLSKTDNEISSNVILKDINQLGQEIIVLKEKLLTSENEKVETNISFMLDSIGKFATLFKKIESIENDEGATNKKRFLLETMIDSIFYDGTTNDVKIKLWGAKKIDLD